MSLQGIHLVSAAAKKDKAAQLRLACPPFLADVISDVRSQPPVHHWLVHLEGSPKILHWGQETTLEGAKTAAMSYIRKQAAEERPPRAA
jgi:hypothetical protein